MLRVVAKERHVASARHNEENGRLLLILRQPDIRRRGRETSRRMDSDDFLRWFRALLANVKPSEPANFAGFSRDSEQPITLASWERNALGRAWIRLLRVSKIRRKFLAKIDPPAMGCNHTWLYGPGG